jgi:hypothetical protein
MAKAYDPNLGYNGFQEYQGSPREEIIDGEPRVFRRYYGPSANREIFLRYMFGATAMVVAPRVEEPCVVVCSQPKTYPRENWSCSVVAIPPFEQLVQHEYYLEPFAYRCEPWNSEGSYTVTGGTMKTIGDASDDLVPDADCGVLIEIEYRVTMLAWPTNIHDSEYESAVNEDEPLHIPDVPEIVRPTSVVIDHEYDIEVRTLKGRHLEVCSYGSAPDNYPSAAAGESINDFTSDDIEPYTTINIHTFTITLRNVPFLREYNDAQQIMGHVNNDVWFGYPAGTVYCAEVDPVPRYAPDGRVRYDIDYRFVARWVPAKGEIPGQVMPAKGPNNGEYVHGGKIGIWYRAWWEFPVPTTTNHWWPVIRKGESDPGGTQVYDRDFMLVPEINFHLGFWWWQHICSAAELDA